jgi:preprotein translocase subunit YajC
MTDLPNFFLILAQQQPAGAPGGIGGLLGNPMVMMGLLVVMFYFLLIRPQQKQRKEQAARINSMKSGDRVVTAGGVHGLVHNIKDHTVVVKVAEGTMIEFEKSAVASVTKRETKDSK